MVLMVQVLTFELSDLLCVHNLIDYSVSKPLIPDLGPKTLKST